MQDWRECINPSRSYAADEIASILGVDFRQIACTMQVDIIKSTCRDDTLYATGRDLLKWGKTALLYDDFLAGFHLLPHMQPARMAQPAPKPVQEPQPAQGPVIYFARCGEYIKIGFTRGKPQQRLKGLSTANPLPVELVATAPGGQDLERELHQRFSAFHWSGEWFVFSDQIREYIASLEG